MFNESSVVSSEVGVVSSGSVRGKRPLKEQIKVIGGKDDVIRGDETWPSKATARAILAKARAEYQLPAGTDNRNKYHRVNDFLSWCAQKFPFYFIPYTVIVSVLHKSDILISKSETSVGAMARQLGQYKQHMSENYGRELHLEDGHARASVDVKDYAKNIFPRREKGLKGKVASTQASLQRQGLDTADGIDTAVSNGWVTEDQGRDLKVVVAGLLLTSGKE